MEKTEEKSDYKVYQEYRDKLAVIKAAQKKEHMKKYQKERYENLSLIEIAELKAKQKERRENLSLIEIAENKAYQKARYQKRKIQASVKSEKVYYNRNDEKVLAYQKLNDLV